MKKAYSKINIVFVSFGLLAILHTPPESLGNASQPLDFNRDVRPILSAKCFACHGPDTEENESGYRLDIKEMAFADLGGYQGITAGKPEDSELYQRIIAAEDSIQMPPPEHKNPLSQVEISVLKRWIEEGAIYDEHWAFEAITRPLIPEIQSNAENAIDHFIGKELEEKKLAFSEQAKPEILFRRIHLDLTGLPPKMQDLDRFLNNVSKESYSAEIDRLMNSPAFAERLAMEWLDVARYADTNGYSIDDHREMWGWRDWVIKAFLNNMPYDEFIRQQLAGDLMENSSDSMKIATGFLRNSMNTHEGGTIAEEYRVASIADKIDTVATAFLGLTIKCAQCHTHKYDPISHRDYYRFFAFFNTSAEPGKGAVNGNTQPLLEVAPILQDSEAFRQSIEQRIASLEFLKTHPEEFLGSARQVWERETLANAPPPKSESSSTPKQFPFPTSEEAKGLSWIWTDQLGAREYAWFRHTFSLDALPKEASLFISCDNEAEIWINGKKLGKNPDWRTPSVFDLTELLRTGSNVIAVAGKDWTKGGSKAALVALIALPDGRYIKTDGTWRVADQVIPGWNDLLEPPGFRQASIVASHGAAPWGDTFAKLKTIANDHDQEALLKAIRKADGERSSDEQNLVVSAFAKSNGEMQKLLNAINGEIAVLQESLKNGKTTVMVMDDSASNRQTHILVRGQYDQHGEVVEAGIPEMLGALDETKPPSRLTLAEWLTAPANPLTARVTVNRYWQMIFGTGLVKTTEDFGSQGDYPSHPELLDWLASEFIESKWDVRFLIKTILLSRTYQQTSNVSPHLIQLDPYNRLLGRAPRFRLSAEAIRDNALQLGGLLNTSLGGPSVYPPQPTGLWKEVSHFGHPTFFTSQHFFGDKTNEQHYRRSLYTFWKRTSPPPVMLAFDAPNRETCAVRRSSTNTPLQALVLMNEPQFVASSLGMARQMLKTKGDPEEKIRQAFRWATCRLPSAKEIEILLAAYQRQLKYFGEHPDRANRYVGGKSDPETAALSSIGSLILNLDETITRE